VEAHLEAVLDSGALLLGEGLLPQNHVAAHDYQVEEVLQARDHHQGLGQALMAVGEVEVALDLHEGEVGDLEEEEVELLHLEEGELEVLDLGEVKVQALALVEGEVALQDLEEVGQEALDLVGVKV